MTKKISALLIFLLLPFLLLAKEIAVFHTSDTHGYYFPRKVLNGKTAGGFALLKGYLNNYNAPYLLLDSGDFSAGTLEAKESKGETSVKLMNAVGYAATTIGNHEADFKEDQMLKSLKDIKFDVLAANIYDLNKLGDSIISDLQNMSEKQNSIEDLNISSGKAQIYPDGVKPYNVYNIDGKKIAVIGIAKDPLRKSQRIKTTNGKKEIQKALAELQNIPHDATILLIHNSIKDEEHKNDLSTIELIKDVKGIDLVLGGHAHNILQKQYDGVQYVESGSYTEGLSKILLTFNDKTGKLTNIKAKYILLDEAKITPDENIAKLAEENRIPNIDTAIGKALEDITIFGNRKNELDSPIQNLLTDIIKDLAPQVDFALNNTGSAKDDILKGKITKRVVINAFPFPNKVMILKAKGNFIKRLIESSISDNLSLFQYSKEVKIQYRRENDKTELVSAEINGQELDENKIYTIAVNDYIAKGKSEGEMFKEIKDKEPLIDKNLSEILMDYILANPKGIKNTKAGRIKKVR